MQTKYDNLLGLNGIQRDMALNNRDLQAQLAQCCCDLRTESANNTQKILDKMCENEINSLRTELQSAQLQISQLSQSQNLINQLKPSPIPAYITCSPYQASTCGYGYGVSSVI